MDAILEARDLTKRYEDFTLRNVSFEVPRGSIMGFFGPNGAGKTTLMKLLASQVPAGSGTLRVFGLSYGDREVEIKNRIGYVPQEPGFYWGKPVRYNARYAAAFFAGWDGGRFYSLLEEVGIRREKKVKHLSRGQKTLLSLALAFSHEADLLLLDEPAAGLDMILRRRLLDELRAFVADGERSVVVSSHVTDGLDQITDHVLFLDGGSLVLRAERDELLSRWKRIHFKEGALEPGVARALLDVRKHPFGSSGLCADFPALRAQLEPAMASGDVRVENVGLDDILVALVKGA